MCFRAVVLTCVVLGGCAGQSASPNRANTVSDSGSAGQCSATGSPSDIATSEPDLAGQLTVTLANAGPDATFEASGLSDEDLAKLPGTQSDPAEWAGIFSLHVISDASNNWKDQPPVLGKYSVAGGHIRFKPDFPLMPGVTYRALFDIEPHANRVPELENRSVVGSSNHRAPVVQDFSLPKLSSEPTTFVSYVFPSADTLPENQLKFYLHFSAPMSRGEAYRRVHLLDGSGNELSVPFLELDEELWDRQARRLTLFLDPGRIKRGLKPREEVGPVFEEGKSYTLVIDREWQDAEGNPLRQGVRKLIHVGPADDKQPDPNSWKVDAPARGTTEPVLIRFPEPLDHAMLYRVIVVHDSSDRLVDGQVTVDENETRWALTPTAVWRAGDYTIEVQTDLEDLAGNSIARVFDVDVLDPISRSIKAERWSVPFRVAE
jgi:hypothetical protein